MARTTCASCQHFGNPHGLSAPCRLGLPSWAWVNPNSPYPPINIVRADNSCERWEAELAIATASESTVPPLGSIAA